MVNPVRIPTILATFPPWLPKKDLNTSATGDVVFAVFPGFTTVFAFAYFFMLAPAFYAYVEQTVPEPVILVPYVASSYMLCLFFDHFLSTVIQRYHLFSL